MQATTQAPRGAAIAAAILFVAFGAVGLLPGLFLVLVSTITFTWYFVLQAAGKPVTVDSYLDGFGTEMLGASPDTPFGLVGFGVIALHCVAAIPAPFFGIAVLRGTAGAEARLRRLGAIYLLVFPLGTLLGVTAIATMGRGAPSPALSTARATSSDRSRAALCYALPLLSAIYFFIGGKSSAFLRMHIIQSSLVGLVLLAIAKAAEALQPLTAVPILPLAVGGSVVVLAGFALLAYAGSEFELPWIGTLAQRTEAGFAKGQEKYQQGLVLRMHQRNLAASSGVEVKSTRPVIQGTRVGDGFQQGTTHSHAYALFFVAGAFAITLLFVLSSAWNQLSAPGGNRVVAAATVFFFGGAIAFAIYLLVRTGLRGASAQGQLLVRSWPLKPGGEVRMLYRAKPRMGGTLESIDVALKCTETISWRDSQGKSKSASLLVHDIVVPTVRPLPSADGSMAAEWTLRLPADASPSFEGQAGMVRWLLMVESSIAGAVDSGHSFDILVAPELAS